MTALSSKNKTTTLEEAIVDGLLEKKGKDAVIMDFSKMQNIAFERFIICSGSSTTQVNAIADAIIDSTITQCKEKPWHTEGRNNAEWILLDYGNIVVHIFLPEKREFYKLEDLWADAIMKPIEER
ncbi:MAG: ribosome silencing factor [Bacteroidetes bacterium]|nr:MAG: ribosome silencing factor [Bacteroidota bacterium]PIE88034.1 MAG: ribosome silencing factor [Bacteroidota bacterium]